MLNRNLYRRVIHKVAYLQAGVYRIVTYYDSNFIGNYQIIIIIKWTPGISEELIFKTAYRPSDMLLICNIHFL